MLDMDTLFGPVSISLALGVISILLLYWSHVRHYSYFKKRGIPSASTVPVFGSLHEGFRAPLHIVENNRYKKLGRIYGHFEASNPALSVAEPALLREILVKDFASFHDRRQMNSGDVILDNIMSVVCGEDWKRIRSIVTPTFSTGKIKRMMSIFKECSSALVQNFKTSSEAGKYIDAKRLYGSFTMDVIASSAFSTNVNSHNDPDNAFIRMARKVFEQGNWKFLFFFIAPRLMKALKIPVFEPTTMDFFRNITHQIVEERRKTGKSRKDFLQLLMDTAQEVSEEQKWDSQDKCDITSNYGKDTVEQQIFKTVTSKHLSMDELVAQSVSFFLAGYDTTSSTLSCATYNIALNPEVQDKLREEVDAVLKENNGELTYEGIQSMKYLDNVISETLRLHPPIGRLERMATADYELGDTGISIPKGMYVSIPVYAIHRDPEFYPNPETFDPDRFTPEERSTREQYTFLPFGAGPRNCVGMRFALTQIKVGLAHIIANFTIQRCSETQVPLEFTMSPGILQPKKIILEIEIRQDSPLAK